MTIVKKSDEPPENNIGLNKRMGLLLAAYGIALLLLIKHIEDFVLFPWGLFYLFSIFGNIDYFILALIGWVIYLSVTLLIVFTKHKVAFIALYLTLIFLLIVNISGCSVIQHQVETLVSSV